MSRLFQPEYASPGLQSSKGVFPNYSRDTRSNLFTTCIVSHLALIG